jgi:hypothetical protein
MHLEVFKCHRVIFTYLGTHWVIISNSRRVNSRNFRSSLVCFTSDNSIIIDIPGVDKILGLDTMQPILVFVFAARGIRDSPEYCDEDLAPKWPTRSGLVSTGLLMTNN